MKKIAIFGVVSVLALTGSGYPPCSETITDRCIQLYEPGVATPTNLALNEQLGPDRAGVGLAAMGGPYEPIEPDDEYAAYEPEEYASDWTAEPVEEDWTAAEDELAYAPPADEYYADEYAYSDDYGYYE